MTAATCDGSSECRAETHVHGCFADFGRCDEPNEHRSAASKPGWAKAELERVRKLVESWPPYLRVHT